MKCRCQQNVNPDTRKSHDRDNYVMFGLTQTVRLLLLLLFEKLFLKTTIVLYERDKTPKRFQKENLCVGQYTIF